MNSFKQINTKLWIYSFISYLHSLQVILVLKSVDRYEITNTSVMVQIVSHVLAYMNSCVNPILYAFLSENFRKAFRKVIYCGPNRSHLPGHINGRPDQEKSALTKTTRTNDILWGAVNVSTWSFGGLIVRNKKCYLTSGNTFRKPKLILYLINECTLGNLRFLSHLLSVW